MTTTRIVLSFAFAACFAITLMAQDRGRGRDRGGDRGGDRDARGGEGSREEGSRWGRSGRGGPPWARGGSSSWGGSRGGFDPSSFLSRLDANGNGIIDPDEQQGPAQFMISRMQRMDPSIKPGQPIPLKKITEGFERMRSGSRDRGRDRSEREAEANEALEFELLVPGFGREEPASPLLGFGATAEMLSAVASERDEREAAEQLRRYDRDRDGFISADELSSRFSGNPMDFDRNRDGKLSSSELAIRAARRREGREQARDNQKKSESKRNSERKERSYDDSDPFNGRQSYRVIASRKLPEGLPGFFTDKDANGDGQVTMAEYASDWSDDLVAEFFDNDFNRDGVITSAEAIRKVEHGGASTLRSRSKSSSASTSSTPATGGQTKASASVVKVVRNIFKRHDKNGDETLTASEWKNMLMNPADADANRDGRITIDEYASWVENRDRERGK